MGKESFIVAKYKGKWAILDIVSNTYYDIGKGYKNCVESCKRLNAMDKINNKVKFDYHQDIFVTE